MRFATRAVHGGYEPSCGPVNVPIFQSSTFAWEDFEHAPEVMYTRYSNPTRQALEKALAGLEGGDRCTCFSSGMAACVACLSLLKSGDHLMIASDVYGGSMAFVEEYLPRMGITYGTFDSCQPGELVSAPAATRMVWFESPTNPTLKICDIAAVAAICKRHGWLSAFDNTFASPALQNPLALGVDLVMHSTTKYISGHSDLVGGAVVTRDPDLGQKVYLYCKMAGSNPAPFECFLSLRGVRTLALRMERHCANAQAVAEYLAKHSRVRSVHYPGLASHPSNSVAAKQMSGYGGMLCFEIEGDDGAASVFASRLKYFVVAASLGGVESLVGYPKLMSHAAMTEEQRLSRGISPNLVRLSVGIEDAQDLLDDLEQALSLTT